MFFPAEGLARSVMEDTLRQLEVEQTVAVAPDTPALEVVNQMRAANTGCALVVDDGKLLGIFTEHDVLTRMSEPPASSDGSAEASRTFDSITVKDLMSSNPETLNETASVAEAVNKMSMGRYRHIPFVKSDRTYAVCSIKSVLKYIAREDW